MINWVKCSERVPELKKTVLIYNLSEKDGVSAFLNYIDGRKFWESNIACTEWEFEEVSHWAEINEPHDNEKVYVGQAVPSNCNLDTDIAYQTLYGMFNDRIKHCEDGIEKCFETIEEMKRNILLFTCQKF